MRVVFLEPHADDIILSSFYLLKRAMSAGHEVVLVTAGFSPLYNPEQTTYSINLAAALGIEHVDLGVHDEGWLGEGVTWQLRDKTLWKRPAWIERYYTPFSLSNKEQEIWELLDDYLLPSDMLVAPAGLQHPWHVAISQLLYNFFHVHVFYAEYPYITRKKVQEALSEAFPCSRFHCQGFWQTPEENEFRWRTFAQFYPKEEGILRYDRHRNWIDHYIPNSVHGQDFLKSLGSAEVLEYVHD